MTVQGLQQIVDELQTTSTHICLKLPANRHSVFRQVEQIAIAQQQLTHLKSKVAVLSHRRMNAVSNRACSLLLQSVDQLLETAESLKLLAEEAVTDPVGAASCLDTINQTNSALPLTIDTLKSMLAPRRRFFF